ncbi:MAG TPA: hypothetical protein VH988_32005 [Thermoanaerobaculia bacterium]|jgi:hypothetical protein|nr:hypothetical protein [Thermoanaerobaculia bacterium]
MTFQTFFEPGLSPNHNQTVVRPTPGISYQHNQTVVRSTTQPRITANHNQTVRSIR